MLAAMGNSPSRWTLAIDVAGLLTRLGDTQRSDQLLNEVGTAIRSTGYTLVSSLVETGLAENAAVRGNWKASQGYVAAARASLPADTWVIESRLQLLDAAAALAAGDRNRAIGIASTVHDEAHRLGDVRTQLEVHSFLPATLSDDGNPRNDDLLIARTGMRGATLDWLVHRM